MPDPTSTPQPNTLGNASLALGILSLSLVFGIGLCAWAGLGAAIKAFVQRKGTPASTEP
jgi:hypothetical protein